MTLADHVIGKRGYELSNHLGNVLTVVSDKPVPHGEKLIDYWMADIRQATDYSPFGVTLSGRNFTLTGAQKSRFGYQGSEMDNEVKGEGNSYTTHYRMLDPRLGRWMSIDPVTQPWQSPYTSMDNNPILLNDPMGDRIKWGDAKGDDKRSLKRQIRVARKQDADFNDWFKSKRSEPGVNIMYSSSGLGPQSPQFFTSPMYKGESNGDRDSKAPHLGTIITIGDGGSEINGDNGGDVQSQYFFAQLERSVTTNSSKQTGTYFGLGDGMGHDLYHGTHYDSKSNSYTSKLELEEKSFSISGYVNPRTTDAVVTTISINNADGSLITQFTVGIPEHKNFVSINNSYGPMLLTASSKTVYIQVQHISSGQYVSGNWSLKAQTTSTDIKDNWKFDIFRMFKRPVLINL